MIATTSYWQMFLIKPKIIALFDQDDDVFDDDYDGHDVREMILIVLVATIITCGGDDDDYVNVAYQW